MNWKIKKLFLWILNLSILWVASTPSYAGTIKAAASGKWEEKSSWAGGKIPQCGDSVIIGSGINIEVTSVIDFSKCGNAMHLQVSGKLSMQPDKKINLPCGSKVAMKEGGVILASSDGALSNSIEICSETAWSGSKGNMSGPNTLEKEPQPVALVHFSAKPGTEGIILSWTTSSENNISNYVVEKSKDGRSFSELGNVKGTGTSSKLNNYKFIDKDPSPGLQYYRLSQKNANGETTVKNPITIRWNHNPDFNVYPNPSKGELFANVANTLRKKIGLLMITNNKGNVVISKDIVFSEKTKALSLLKPAEHLKPGEYEVNVICQGNLYSQQVTVE